MASGASLSCSSRRAAVIRQLVRSVAAQAADAGARVTVASSSQDRVAAAAKRLSGDAAGVQRYWGALWAAKHAAPHIVAGGSITFTSGTVATRAAPGTSLPASVSGATEALTRALALELAPVRVNAVRPGPVRSSMWTDTVPDPQDVYDDFASRSPLARIAEPEEIAAAYTFLMNSPNTTGTILTSDAGTVLV